MAKVKFGTVDLPLNTKPPIKELVPPSIPYVPDNEVLKKVALGVALNSPVLLIGETGTGKTSLVRYLAHKTNNSFRRVNLHGGIGAEELLGKVLIKTEENGKTPVTYFQEGVLVEALKKGYWLLLDEINATNPEILFTLHSLLDDDRMIVLAEKDGEIIKPHPNFRLFCGMNPSDTYAGTKVLNPAFLSRFLVVEMTFPSKDKEEKIIKAWSDDGITREQVTGITEVAKRVRKAYEEERISYVCSTRDLIQFATLLEHLSFVEAVDIAIVNKAPKEDRPHIQKLLALVFGSSVYPFTKGDVEKTEEEKLKDKVKILNKKLKKRSRECMMKDDRLKYTTKALNHLAWAKELGTDKLDGKKAEKLLTGKKVQLAGAFLKGRDSGEIGVIKTGFLDEPEPDFEWSSSEKGRKVALSRIYVKVKFEREEAVREGSMYPTSPFPLTLLTPRK